MLENANGTSDTGEKLTLGEQVPDFTCLMTGAGQFQLSNYRGKKLVLFFYPKDNTPGCTTESAAFRDLHAQFISAGALVFGISRDTLRSHESFKSKLGLQFELLSDPDEKICALFDVMKIKNMYGKKVRGIERCSFVIDATGRLVKEWRQVKVLGHADDVLDFISALS